MPSKKPQLTDTAEGRALAGTAKKMADAKFETIFVNYSLSADEKRQLRDWEPSLSELDDELFGICHDLFKLTVKYDAYSDGYAAWLVPHASNKQLAGMILSGRGSTPFKAVKQLVWLHKMMGGHWQDYAQAKREFEFDD